MSRRVAVERYIEYDEKNKTYLITLYHGKDEVTGKVKKEYTTSSTLREARKVLRLFECDKDKGKLKTISRETVQSYCVKWLESKSKEVEATTSYAYRNIINNHVIPYLGKIELQKIKPRHIEEYISYLRRKKNLSNNTILKHQAMLQNIFNDAVINDVMEGNPLLKLKKVKKSKIDIQCYSIEECKALLSKARGHNLEIAIYLALFCGLRREEVNGLKWRKVNLDKYYFSVEEVVTAAGATIVQKGPKSEESKRDMGIPGPVYDLLIRINQNQNKQKSILGNEYEDNDLVFCKENGKPFRPNYISSELLRFIKKQELPHITFHGLRHTYATIIYNSTNLDIKYLSKSLGHASESITKKVYIHPEKEINSIVPNAVADLLM